MEKEEVINYLNRIALLFENYSNEVENRKERHNVSYYNGYQACCDDIYTVIEETIHEIQNKIDNK